MKEVIFTIFRLAMIIGLLCAFAVLVGCATVEVSTPEMTIKTTTLWKDINDASAQTDEMVLQLGSSTSEQDAASALLLVCTLSPASPICNREQ